MSRKPKQETVARLAEAANPDNPRTITPEKLGTLRQSLALYGDIGGIVRNQQTGNMVGGHQRIAAFQDDPEAAVKIIERLPKPDAVGTVALGYVLIFGTRFSFREVDWPAAKEKGAMLAANQLSGEFDSEAVARLLDELKAADFDIAMTGFDEGEMEQILKQFNASETEPPALESGDRAPFRQCTFTLHDEQFEVVEAAIKKAKSEGGGESAVNENSNGNALAWVCGRFNRG